MDYSFRVTIYGVPHNVLESFEDSDGGIATGLSDGTGWLIYPWHEAPTLELGVRCFVSAGMQAGYGLPEYCRAYRI
jgi:hypothetical protein